MRNFKMLCLLSALVLTLGLAAQAQSAGNVFGGYTFLRQGNGAPHLNGWNASLEGRVLPHLGAVVEVSGNLGSQGYSTAALTNIDYSRVNFYAGPRLSLRIGNLRPFAHVMIGVSHFSTKLRHPSLTLDETSTNFAMLTGGGVDVNLLPHVDWRNQIDMVSTRNGDTHNEFRYTTGVVFRF